MTNLQSFIGRIIGSPPTPGKVVVYRGHPNEDYLLRPAIFRSPIAAEREHILLRDLIAAHPQEFAADGSTLELLVRMQHYSLPTRLLDVTWNPLVALYFASEPQTKKTDVMRMGRMRRRTVPTDGEVIKLTIDESLVRYFDSDTVSCLTNLARCRFDQKEELRTMTAGKPTFSKTARATFNGKETVKRLLHFIRTEKPAFEPEIVPEQLSRFFLVKPKYNNRRILAQEGAFMVLGLTEEVPATGARGIVVERITIQARRKGEIMSQLGHVSINQRTMFPEIDRAARYLTDGLTTSALLSRGTSPAR
ncbi:FRG domain-containing protein [Lichenihabitans psoromatis]|uniref:FRG domain-containing protein n=1 Tax=Lichenihabitans psoromatis TaxID=2528642 RepID=UPI0013F15053|nr:FRG domain-containing protein [Lichenihabitans psoromatis]